MSIRIQLSRATVKDLYSRLQYAYQCDDVRLVRRTTVLIDLLVHRVPVGVLGERWGLSPACLYAWRRPFSCTAWTACSTTLAAVAGPN